MDKRCQESLIYDERNGRDLLLIIGKRPKNLVMGREAKRVLKRAFKRKKNREREGKAHGQNPQH